jgi:hypothetical protein
LPFNPTNAYDTPIPTQQDIDHNSIVDETGGVDDNLSIRSSSTYAQHMRPPVSRSRNSSPSIRSSSTYAQHMPPPPRSRDSSQSKRRRNLQSVELTEAEITNERLEAQIRDLEQRKRSITLRQKVDRLEQELLELEQQ